MDEIIKNHLTEYNESIKENTIKKYVRNIVNLKNYLNYDNNDLNYLNNYDEILEILDHKNYSTQTKNSYICSCLQTCKAFKFDNKLINKYTQKIKEYNNQIKAKYEKQEKSEKQEKNWVSWEVLTKFYRKYRNRVRRLRLTKIKDLSYKNFIKLQNMVILSCYFSSIDNPPRRNIYASLLIKKLDKKNNYFEPNTNYLLIKNSRIKYFLFQNYKTSKNYGTVKIRINPELNNDINLYLRHNKSKFFLPAKTKNRPMTTEELTKRLQQIFKINLKKNISTQMIRQIFVSKIYENTAKYTTLKDLSSKMGHSFLTAFTKYNKKDDESDD